MPLNIAQLDLEHVLFTQIVSNLFSWWF